MREKSPPNIANRRKIAINCLARALPNGRKYKKDPSPISREIKNPYYTCECGTVRYARSNRVRPRMEHGQLMRTYLSETTNCYWVLSAIPAAIYIRTEKCEKGKEREEGEGREGGEGREKEGREEKERRE